MKDASYYYEMDMSQLLTMGYPEGVKCKLRAAIKVRDKLINEDYRTRDNHRLNDVLKAIKHNKELLAEVGIYEY